MSDNAKIFIGSLVMLGLAVFFYCVPMLAAIVVASGVICWAFGG